jgi:glycosyltransferase involved in cell wall biosynthesis
MLERVLQNVLRRNKKVHVHVIASRLAISGLREALPSSERLSFHTELGDEALLRLYQSSCVTLLPMVDCGASTAVVDALAAGLPPLTTDVGGIRDYGGGDVFPVVERNDHERMAELALRYLEDKEWRRQVAMRCREFAEVYLSWPAVASQHIALYLETLKSWMDQ